MQSVPTGATTRQEDLRTDEVLEALLFAVANGWRPAEETSTCSDTRDQPTIPAPAPNTFEAHEVPTRRDLVLNLRRAVPA